MSVKEIINAAAEEKFSEFSDKVRQSLEDKMRNHPEVQRLSSEYQKYSNAKQTYQNITKR